jgi:hypothetical protein
MARTRRTARKSTGLLPVGQLALQSDTEPEKMYRDAEEVESYGLNI